MLSLSLCISRSQARAPLSRSYIKLLRTFVDIELALPNMVVGRITREHMHRALKNGISAEKAYEFLRQHAHPIKAAAGLEPVPATVAEHLDIWERERTRVRVHPNVILHQSFGSRSAYDAMKARLSQQSKLLKCSDTHHWIVEGGE